MAEGVGSKVLSSIPIVGDILGGLFNIFGAADEARQKRRQFQLAAFQATQRAADALSRGGTSAAQALSAADRARGAQRASTAGRNFEIGTGTAADITAATDLVGSIEAFTIRENARREARAHLTDAYSATQGFENVSASGEIAGTLLSTAGNFASNLERRRRSNLALADVGY